ncbi:RNA polymerase sigma factor [Phycisphaerales bacterium AB-hyl4]|uniref:RNA polymerase sigma factor n=1 Tax=Natronomicrosphaera hydrolytica TaxID=3242702 RepID=A0ABV4U745_9BACT
MGETDGSQHDEAQSTWQAEHWPDVEAVYRAHVVDVWRFVCRRLHGNRDAADDVTSQVFMAMVEHADRFDPTRASIESWLFGIARHKLADHLRRAYREQKHHRAWQAMQPDFEPGPLEALGGPDTAEMNAVLDKLPTNERDALVWKYCDRLSTRRIADRMGRSEKACENLLYRARHRFRSLYNRLTEDQDHEVRR